MPFTFWKGAEHSAAIGKNNKAPNCFPEVANVLAIFKVSHPANW
jgi:hypothetical protein